MIVRLNLEARRFELQLRLTEFVDPGSDLEGNVKKPGGIRGCVQRIIADRCHRKVVMVA